MIYYIISVILFMPIIFFLAYKIFHTNKPKTDGYNCQNHICTYVDENSQFRTKKDCNNFCAKKVQAVKLDNSNIKSKVKTKEYGYKCDRSNCVCNKVEINNNVDKSLLYSNFNNCQLNCDNCHNNLVNSYAIKPDIYYSALPNIPVYPLQYQYYQNSYYNDPYLQYPYGLEPPPFLSRPSLCKDRR